MTIKEKLGWFKDKVKDYTSFNESFAKLVGIELYDYIHENEILKNEFNKRVNYLSDLAKDKEFELLQDELFESVQEVLKTISIDEVNECQSIWKNKTVNRLKMKKDTGDRMEDIWLTLPEIFEAIKDKNNYYRLGDSSPYSIWDGEISLITHVAPVKKQYEVNIELLFKRISINRSRNNNTDYKYYEELLSKYNKSWYKFDERIYRIPVKLHTQNFEEFFSDCVRFYQREGYEFQYDFFKGYIKENDTKRFNKVKTNIMVVIDDLIDILDVKEDNGKKPSNLSSTPLEFIVSVKDREIFINESIISRPHAIGKNMEIFEFIRKTPKMIFRASTLPENLKSKPLSKVFNELGFRGEILKAFFSKRGKIGYLYAGDVVYKEELIERGIKIPKLLRELEIAHLRNSPV